MGIGSGAVVRVRARVRVRVGVRVMVTVVLVERAAAKVRDGLLPLPAHAAARGGQQLVVREALAWWGGRARVRG